MVLSSIDFSVRKPEGLRNNFNEVRDFVDHATHGRGVLQLGNRVDTTQTQAAHGGTVILTVTALAMDVLNFDSVCHVDSP